MQLLVMAQKPLVLMHVRLSRHTRDGNKDTESSMLLEKISGRH